MAGALADAHGGPVAAGPRKHSCVLVEDGRVFAFGKESGGAAARAGGPPPLLPGALAGRPYGAGGGAAGEFTGLGALPSAGGRGPATAT